MEDNEALDETTYLLRSPANARRLLESIKEVEKASIKKVSINSLLKPHKKETLVFSKIISNCRKTLVNSMMKLQNDLLINQLEHAHDNVSQ